MFLFVTKQKLIVFICVTAFGVSCKNASFVGAAKKNQPQAPIVKPSLAAKNAGNQSAKPSSDPKPTFFPPPVDHPQNPGAPPGPPALFDSQADTNPKRVPKFGLLINNFRCAMCHLTINGDVAATRNVDKWSSHIGHVDAQYNQTRELINGRWFIAGNLSKTAEDGRSQLNINVAGGVVPFYRGPEMPKDLDGNGAPDFPVILFDKIAPKMAGKLSANGVSVQNVAPSSQVLLGTDSQPIVIEGEVLIQGDLVIKGKYKGVGTIYVTGNIYIPFDLRAMNSAFPYPSDAASAVVVARDFVKGRKKDGLALASASSIFIGDLGTNLYDNTLESGSAFDRAALGVDNVYRWIPGGKSGYDALYEKGVNCLTGRYEQHKSFNLIEAMLYAQKEIDGISRMGSWAINGGVIANVLHIIARAGAKASPQTPGDPSCPSTPSPTHGFAQDRNWINYDYRLQTGLELLHQFSPYF